MYVLLLGCFFGIIQIPTMNFLYGTSRNRFFAFSNALEGVINIILSIILIGRYGLVGMAWGMTLAAVLVKLIIQPLWVCRVFKLSLLGYHLYHTLPNVIRPVIYIGCFYMAAHYLSTPSYLRLLLMAVGAFLLLVPYLFFIGFSKEERALLTKTIFKSRAAPQVS